MLIDHGRAVVVFVDGAESVAPSMMMVVEGSDVGKRPIVVEGPSVLLKLRLIPAESMAADALLRIVF